MNKTLTYQRLIQDPLVVSIVLLITLSLGGGLTALMIITNQNEVVIEANKIITEHKCEKE